MDQIKKTFAKQKIIHIFLLKLALIESFYYSIIRKV